MEENWLDWLLELMKWNYPHHSLPFGRIRRQQRMFVIFDIWGNGRGVRQQKKINKNNGICDYYYRTRSQFHSYTLRGQNVCEFESLVVSYHTLLHPLSCRRMNFVIVRLAMLRGSLFKSKYVVNAWNRFLLFEYVCSNSCLLACLSLTVHSIIQ